MLSYGGGCSSARSRRLGSSREGSSKDVSVFVVEARDGLTSVSSDSLYAALRNNDFVGGGAGGVTGRSALPLPLVGYVPWRSSRLVLDKSYKRSIDVVRSLASPSYLIRSSSVQRRKLSSFRRMRVFSADLTPVADRAVELYR